MGCSIDNLTMEETLETVERFIETGTPHQHVAVNVDKLVKAQSDPELRQIINECALISADGMPVVWASRLLGISLKERVTGIDLFEALMKRAARKRWRIYLLGAREEVVSTVKALYESKYPGLTITGYRNGFWAPEEDESVAAAISSAGVDILFVAISSPKKEQFLGHYQAQMRVPFAMGVGGTFDVAAGKLKRAPRWMQAAGMEWFFRFLQEPRRMFRRYFIEDMAFFRLLAREIIRGKFLEPHAGPERRSVLRLLRDYRALRRRRAGAGLELPQRRSQEAADSQLQTHID
jgi:N-acetylglucosaminyldiphosphoundecaprenol N-acetyl-beta-D-mannosaminyltransferase